MLEYWIDKALLKTENMMEKFDYDSKMYKAMIRAMKLALGASRDCAEELNEQLVARSASGIVGAVALGFWKEYDDPEIFSRMLRDCGEDVTDHGKTLLSMLGK